jgi:DNA-directed RNA polymerase specialized sigma24 family protein
MRATLVLRYYEDLTEAETAAALDCSVGSVKSQTHHALKRLRTALGADRRSVVEETR